MSLGLVEILLVVLVFLVMGPRRIADLFRSVGRGAHDFVDNLGRDKVQRELENPEEEDTPSPKQ